MDYFFVFFIGSCIGSFLNVVIYRSISEISVIYPPSFCPKCLKPIRWYDNIPVVSYLILKGRCRNCKSEISISYPVVEILTGIITLVIFLKWWYVNIWWCIGGCIVSYILIVASVIDVKVMMLSDLFSYLIAFTSIVFAFSNPMFEGDIKNRVISSFFGIISGAGFMYVLLVVGKFIYKRDAVGEGDVFLLGSIGSIVGWKGVFDVIFISSFLGSVYGLWLIFFRKTARYTPIPFGPFLAAACIIKIIYPFRIFDFLL